MFGKVRRGAVVIAHPDDETMWCGGLMARYPARWTVICCSIPRTDPIRAYKFFDACKIFGAFPRLVPVVETDPNSELDGFQSYLDLSQYDCIVTHNDAGEYGHRHHLSVHRFVTSHHRNVLTIGYGKPHDPEALLINLDEMEMARKLTALRCYDHVSPSDGKPKWQALIDRYSTMFDLGIETYARA